MQWHAGFAGVEVSGTCVLTLNTIGIPFRDPPVAESTSGRSSVPLGPARSLGKGDPSSMFPAI